jgi:hypothetical protein
LAEIKRTEGSHSAKGHPPVGDAEKPPKSLEQLCAIFVNDLAGKISDGFI